MTLPPNQAAWLPVAENVIAGHYDKADRSTLEILTIGLRSIPHPLCQKAIEKLKSKKKP